MESFLLGSELKTFPTGQGYPYKSYKGGVDAVRETFLYSQDAFAATRDRGVLRDVRGPLWPLVKERRVDFGKFDPDNLLFRSGAHAPLMVWIGHQGRRSQERLQAREERAIARNWGRAVRIGQDRCTVRARGPGRRRSPANAGTNAPATAVLPHEWHAVLAGGLRRNRRSRFTILVATNSLTEVQHFTNTTIVVCEALLPCLRYVNEFVARAIAKR